MKLNIGGGLQPMEGFLNVDLCETADIKHDLRNTLPFEDKSVDEIMAVHVVESFYQWEFPNILKDWYRVLNGKLTIEFTELNATIFLYLNGNEEETQRGHWGLYGDQSVKVDERVVHHYVYEKSELYNLLANTGFKNIKFTKEGINHVPARDWRVICFT
jgi:predicted SAM-dependent methyltransferase